MSFSEHALHAPVAVFDSGFGGLTVLRALRAQLPAEDFFYFADTRYFPYGERPADFLRARCVAIAQTLQQAGAKALVIACNTASAVAAEAIRAAVTVPVIALEPGVKPATERSDNGRIGVLATQRTLESERFQRLLATYGHGAQIFGQACTGLADAIENEGPASARVAALLDRYVTPLAQHGVDTVVLGCTHYPWASAEIAQRLPAGTYLLDTGAAVARQLARRLQAEGCAGGGQGRLLAAASVDPVTVAAKLERLWGAPLSLVYWSPADEPTLSA